MKQTQRTEKKAEFLPSLLVMVAAILVLVGGILVLKLGPHIPHVHLCTGVLRPVSGHLLERHDEQRREIHFRMH